MSDLYIKNSKSNTTIVFIHGWCMDIKSFDKQITYFKQKYSIWSPDYSRILKLYPIHNDLFKNIVLYIKKRIINNKLKNVILVGHSMGGIISLALMQALPHTIKKCVIIESTITSPLAKHKPFDDFLAALESIEDNLYKEKLIGNLINTRMINHNLDNIYLAKKQKHDMLLKWRQTPSAYIQLLKSATLFNSAIGITKCAVPLMYIPGKPSSSNLDMLMELNKKIIIKQIPSGHFIMSNKPKQLNLILQNFFTTR